MKRIFIALPNELAISDVATIAHRITDVPYMSASWQGHTLCVGYPESITDHSLFTVGMIAGQALRTTLTLEIIAS